MLIYAFLGKNSIKVQYLRKKPNMKKIEKEEIEFDLKINKIIVKNVINVKNVKTIKTKNIKKSKFAPKSKSKFSNPQKKKKREKS